MPLTRIEPAAIADTRGVNFRNIIINGDMSVAQRGTSFTGITSTQTYTLDRWFGRSFSTSSMNVSQSTDAPDGFLYSAKCQKPSGQSASIMRFEQPFETNNIIYLRGQKVTVSFYAKKGADYSVTNNALPVVLFAGDGTERARNITAFDNETAPINTSVTLTDSWQKFSVTSSNLPSDVSQLALQFQPTTTVTAGADESFFITGVQLEAGEVASDFEFLPFDVNLRRCHRYCNTLMDYGNGDVLGNRLYSAAWAAGGFARMSIPIMRIQPTLTYGIAAGGVVDQDFSSPELIQLYDGSDDSWRIYDILAEAEL